MKRLIFIIGIEGTGKTTLAKQLIAKNKKIHLIDELVGDYKSVSNAFQSHNCVIACIQPITDNKPLMKSILTTNVKEAGIECSIEFKFCKKEEDK